MRIVFLSNLKSITLLMYPECHDDDPVTTPFVPSYTNQHNEHFQNTNTDSSSGETTIDSSSTDHNSIPLVHVPFPESPESVMSGNQAPRQSTRQKAKPIWMEHYITNVTENSNVSTADHQPSCSQMKLTSQFTPPTYPYTTSPNLHQTYVAYLANVSKVQVPNFYHQACKDKGWIHAMNEELAAL
ncbi:Uncharacterized protein Adt_37514 [Abeliophyllum distichum]|uniref:Uncharacterized protein n=1 Tax=Abeliophyllum distichum TaxID=126358 RepID=A0ABD1QKN2_9LAMI